MKAAPCSWWVGMNWIRESRSEIRTSAFSSPGTPKMYSTPSASRHRRNRSLAFMQDRHLHRPFWQAPTDRPGRDSGAGTRLQVQGDVVHAVALAGRPRTVVEKVAQVATTAAAPHLGPHHEMRAILHQLDGVGVLGLVEARPAGAAVELGRGVEQFGTARAAAVDAVSLVVGVLAGERRLGGRLPQHLAAVRGQLLPPLVVALAHLMAHAATS